MPILTTDRGLAAITDADAGGFLVDLTNFAVTEAQGVDLAVTDSKVVGEVVYENRIQSIEVVSSSTVKLTLYIPPQLPKEGRWNLTELGLYLRSGEMFAHGTFKTPREKTTEYGLKIIVYVTANRLGNVINITVGTNASLASAANVRSLVDPRVSDVNAIVVQDGLDTNENVFAPTSGTLAVKYGAGGLNWAFMGHDLTYRGNPRHVIDKSTFVMNASKEGGFWLDHNEVVIIQIVAGPGAGESRRVKYDRDHITFNVLEEAFSDLSDDSLLHVWRSTRHQLPYRSPDIDSNYVLGVGKNTWTKKESTNADSATDLVPHRVSLVGDGAKTSFALVGVPKTSLFDKNQYLVFVNGELVSIESFNVSVESGLTLLNMDPPANGVPIEVVYYTTEKSAGSALTFSMTDDFANGGTFAFNLPMIPKSVEYIMVFVDHKLIPASEYIFAGTAVTFINTAPTGNVRILCCGNFDELGANSTMQRVDGRIQIDANSNVVPIDLPVAVVDKRNTLVFINHQLESPDNYDVQINKLVFNVKYPAGATITAVVYEAKVEPVFVTDVEGENTGPVWVDPAGAFVPTNRIEAKRVSYIGDGHAASFRMMSRADKAIVFLDGLFQSPTTMDIDSENGIITLPDVLAPGKEIDIISFESFPDEIGREVKCWRQNFTTVAGQRAYTIDAPPAGLEPQVTIISIGGVYAHASKYAQTATSITFDADVPAGMYVELWHFATIESFGFSSAVSFGSFGLDSAQIEYIHSYYDAVPITDKGNVQNTLLFGSTVQQLERDYTVDNSTAYKFLIPDVKTAHSVRATSIVFYSGKSKTRLVTRDELNKRYMTREEILRLAFGGTYTPDPGGGGDGGGNGGEGSGAKAMFLSSTSQIFAIGSDGSVTPSTITFTANPQNVTGKVVFSVLFGTAKINSGGSVATLTNADMQSDSVTIRARITDSFDNVSYFDDITVVKLSDGSDAVTAILTNESHTVGADVSGVVSSYEGASTAMEIYRGTSKETDKWTFTRSNGAGVESTIQGNVVQITKLTTLSAYIDITASREGGFASIVKRFSISMSKTGTNGTNGAAALMAMLDNESYTLAAASDGTVSDFSGSKTTIKIFSGQTDDTGNWTITKSDSAGVTSTLNGATVTVSGFAKANDTGWVTITAKRTGYPTLTKQFTLSKAKGTTGSGSGATGPRGSTTVYVPNQTTWSDSVANAATAYGGGPMLNDLVVEYSSASGYSQSRMWDGSKWALVTQVLDGGLLVRGSVGADSLAANSIRANSAVIQDGALGTLKLAGNSVTQAQATTMGPTTQLEVSSVEPSAMAVLSMVVTVTGTQPILVWSSWANPGVHLGTASDYDQYYYGQYWKLNTQFAECQAFFRLQGGPGTFTAGLISTSLTNGATTSASLQAVFQNVPAGTYVLSLMMMRPANLPNFSFSNYAVRSASLAFLETKR